MWGRFLRRTSIIELPANVILGDKDYESRPWWLAIACKNSWHCLRLVELHDGLTFMKATRSTTTALIWRATGCFMGGILQRFRLRRQVARKYVRSSRHFCIFHLHLYPNKSQKTL